MQQSPGCSAETLQLSSQEVKLLRLIAQGLPLASIARELGTSERTVRRRGTALCDRLRVATPIEAVVWAVRSGVV